MLSATRILQRLHHDRAPVEASDIEALSALEQEARKSNPLTQAKFPLLAKKPKEQLGTFPTYPTPPQLTSPLRTRHPPHEIPIQGHYRHLAQSHQYL